MVKEKWLKHRKIISLDPFLFFCWTNDRHNSSILPLEGSQGQMTGVSPWKPRGACKDAVGKKLLKLEVPSDVIVVLRAGGRARP